MFKKKIFIIILHVLAWAAYLFLPNISVENDFDWNRFVLRNNEMPFMIAYFYLNFYLIIPRLLERKKIIVFIAATVFCFLVFLLINPYIDIYVFKNFMPQEGVGHGFREYARRVAESGYRITLRGTFRNIGQMFVFFAISTGWKMYLSWRNEEKKKDQAQQEKLATELNLLKMQVSPHFLFNSLNSIYSLTVKQSENAPTAVVKLSELLRYMIYYAKKDTVLLSEELAYVRNYIELQRLRLAEDITINYHVDIKEQALEIEPMLLIPIIENCFKHGVSYKEPAEININIELKQNELCLKTNNRIFPKKKDESSGFGLENLKKRLNLRYPDLFRLKIDETGEDFNVDFRIKLKE